MSRSDTTRNYLSGIFKYAGRLRKYTVICLKVSNARTFRKFAWLLSCAERNLLSIFLSHKRNRRLFSLYFFCLVEESREILRTWRVNRISYFFFFFFTEEQFSNLVHCQSMSHRPFIWPWNKVCVFSSIQNFQDVVWFDSYSISIKFCQRISYFEGIRIFEHGENLLV